MMAGLPAYSGPSGFCPACGLPGAMTEWHWAGPLAPPDMAGRRPPCAHRTDLAVLDGTGEHLCRVCLNCGHGWPEACTGQAASLSQVPLEAQSVWAGLLTLGGGLASTGADTLLSRVLSGTALLLTLLAVIVAISALAATGYAAVIGLSAQDPADDQAAGS